MIKFLPAKARMASLLATCLLSLGSYAQTKISNADGLKAIADNPNADYVLTSDIDLSGVDFTPISDFTGTLDGQGHVIRNLTIDNADANQQALFATTTSATIKNLGLEKAHVVGYQDAAGFVGKAFATTISSCYIADSYIEGRDHVASIVGNMEAQSGLDGSTITDCLSNAVIRTRKYQAGGIVGCSSGGTIKNCYFSGTIDDEGAFDGSGDWTHACGILGLIDKDSSNGGTNLLINDNLVAASHIYGGITWGSDIDRIFCPMDRYFVQDGVQNYAIASMSIDKRGTTFSGFGNANFVQGETVDDATAKTRNFFENTLGWDFNNTWKFLDGAEGKMYPVLKWMTAPLSTQIFDLPDGSEKIFYRDGTQFEPLSSIHGSWGQDLKYTITEGGNLVHFKDGANDRIYVGDAEGNFVDAGTVTVDVANADEVSRYFTLPATSFSFSVDDANKAIDVKTAQDFVNINNNLGANYVLANDIDMSGVDFGGIATGNDAFSGSLNGNGHKVTNLSLSFNGGGDKGVFGKTNGAIIQNIAFDNLNINAASCDRVGLIGTASNTTVSQLSVTNGYVTGSDHVGLLAGDADGLGVINTTLQGDVVAGSQAGGFAGCTTAGGATFENSLSNVNVSCTYRGWAGGFIGLINVDNSYVTINNCVSLGNLSSTGNGSPWVVGPFIAGNGADNTPLATVYFNDKNIYNSDATYNAANIDQAWPAKNNTKEGGDVSMSNSLSSEALKQQASYTNIGWDFDKVWKMGDADYGYPVLKLFEDTANGISNVSLGDSQLEVVNGKLVVSGSVKNAHICVFTADGRKVADSAASSSISLPAKGLYIVSIKAGNTVKNIKVLNK